MMFQPQLPPHPAEAELHHRERLARERVRSDMRSGLIWYIALAVIIVVLLALLAVYGLHLF